MTSSVYLLGPPGVGKSTLMGWLLRGYSCGPAEKVDGYSPLVVEPLAALGWPDDPGVYLGRHRDNFPGTDALSMSVLPAAVRWAAEAPLPPVVLGEGARLAHLKFLSALAARGPLAVLYLTAPDFALRARRAVRGSNQSEAWARGQGTRARNVAESARAAGLDVYSLWATGDPVAIKDRARGFLLESGIRLP